MSKPYSSPTGEDLTVDLSDTRNRRQWKRSERRALLLVGASPVVANLVGSAFNITYNWIQVFPRLSPDQLARFNSCLAFYNLLIYPIAVFCWALPLIWLLPRHRALLAGRAIDSNSLVRAQRCIINLPWWILTVAGVSWLACIPVFWGALASLDEPLDRGVVLHLVTSFLTGALLSVTQSFFAVEIVSQKTLFPVFFRNENPADVPGGLPLSIRGRGVMWTFAAVVSPVISLLLLILVPDAADRNVGFGLGVGVAAIAFGMTTSWMLSMLVEKPVRQLGEAATQVMDGNYSARVNLLHADDFGPLIARFNEMVEGLSERERLQQTFGRHVGHEAARQIIKQGDGLVGSERVISVMFVDVRNFTKHSANHTPSEVVSALNIFFRDAVEHVEAHGGMVNKFLGDGFMALFGAGADESDHALHAVEAGRAMLCCLDESRRELEAAGWPGLQIGIGINTGSAIVGSIGSPRRQEYTAIGDTVNVAARVESLTKELGRFLLITAATREQLPGDYCAECLGEHLVKGKGQPLHVFAVNEQTDRATVTAS